MQHGERRRGVEVVVHRRHETGGQLTGSAHADPLDRPLHEALDPPVRDRGLAQRVLGVVDAGPVVRGGVVVAQLHRAHPERGHVVEVERVAERLAHLGAADAEQAVVHPVAGERQVGGLRLGDLVLVVRERQVEPAAVDVELGAQVTPAHRRALDVPAGPAATPRRRPGGLGRLARLDALPEREVTRVALAPVGGVAGRLHVGRGLPGQCAVRRPGRHVEVDVAGAVGGRVGVPGLDQSGDQLVHLRNVTGGPRLVGRRQHVQRPVGGGEDLLVGVRDRPERPALLDGLGQHLVVDVGQVADERDLEPVAQQPATQHVVVDAGAKVADVRGRLERETTQVDPHLAGFPRDEVPHRSGGGVIQA